MQLFQDVVAALEEAEIPWALCCGTLIATMRDGVLMGWDTRDLDMIIPNSKWADAQEVVVKFGREKLGLEKLMRGGGGAGAQLNAKVVSVDDEHRVYAKRHYDKYGGVEGAFCHVKGGFSWDKRVMRNPNFGVLSRFPYLDMFPAPDKMFGAAEDEPPFSSNLGSVPVGVGGSIPSYPGWIHDVHVTKSWELKLTAEGFKKPMEPAFWVPAAQYAYHGFLFDPAHVGQQKVKLAASMGGASVPAVGAAAADAAVSAAGAAVSAAGAAVSVAGVAASATNTAKTSVGVAGAELHCYAELHGGCHCYVGGTSGPGCHCNFASNAADVTMTRKGSTEKKCCSMCHLYRP